MKTWTGVAEAGELSFAVPVVPGEVYAFSFSATAGGETVTSSGRVEARATARWFDVDWKTDGYAAGPDWNAPAAAANARGTWMRPAGDDSSLAAGALAYSLDAGAARIEGLRTLAFDLAPDGRAGWEATLVPTGSAARFRLVATCSAPNQPGADLRFESPLRGGRPPAGHRTDSARRRQWGAR